jgi:hypothetical protein
LKNKQEVIDMKDKRLKDILPELGQIIAHDFSRFQITWLDILVGYAKVFDKLLDILMMPTKAETEAVKAIEEYIASRQKPYGQWKSPDWLAYKLSEIIDKTEEKTEELAEDELPF